MNDERQVKALVVYESFFGNTESIARAIAGGVRLEGATAIAMDVANIEEIELDEYDLLIVGGPTHAFALSRPATRVDAVARGGDDRYSERGLREWLTALPAQHGTRLAATFDTRVSKVRHLPASAARSAAHILRQRGFTLTARPTGFIVQDIEGPLDQREMERAMEWGRSLACDTQEQITAGHEVRRRSFS